MCSNNSLRFRYCEYRKQRGQGVWFYFLFLLIFISHSISLRNKATTSLMSCNNRIMKWEHKINSTSGGDRCRNNFSFEIKKTYTLLQDNNNNQNCTNSPQFWSNKKGRMFIFIQIAFNICSIQVGSVYPSKARLATF